MQILDLVRRAAKGRTSDLALAAEARGIEGDWRVAEQTLAGEIAASPRRSRRLVDAFERVAAASGIREARGRAARLTGSYLTYVKRFGESRRAYRNAISLLDGAARDGARIGLAASETRLGRFAEARRLCGAARRDAKRRGDALLGAGADLNEAMALHESGSPRAAVPLYARARLAFAAAENRRLEARSTMDLANALVLLDRYAEAAPLYDEAASLFRSLGHAFDGALCRYNAGALAVSMERLGDADIALTHAEAEFRAAGDPSNAALARLDRGEAMLRAGLVPEALRLCESARRALGRGVPPVERLRASNLAARAALAAGDAAAARRLVGASSARGVRGAGAERSEILARALAHEGRFASARARLELAAREFGSDRPSSRARCLAAAAFCANETGDTAAARRLISLAARTARPLGVPSLDFAVAATQFVVEDTAGRRSGASRALASSILALERVRGGLGSDAMRSALLAGREAWLARAMRHSIEGPDGAERALVLLERFRGRALADLIGAADAAAPRDEKLAKLRAAVAALERRTEGGSAPAFLRSVAAPARGALRAAERALAEASAARLSADSRDAADLAKLRASLPDGTLVVSLWSDENRTVCFAADRAGVSAISVPGGAPVVQQIADELRFSVGKFAFGEEYARRHAQRLATDVDERLARLAELSIGPIANEVSRARRVVIVPHGPWHRVPFAALPVAGRRLVDLADVALAPAFGALTNRADAPDGASIVMSRADGGAPGIDAESRAVAAVLEGAGVFAGDDATFAVLERARSPRCVHVAAHGRFRPDAPALGGVLLADGWLRALDFTSLRLPGALVVLSGCETGVSSVGPGDEIHGLVRGVFASGAAELVASLWRVGDDATTRFMVAFHEHRARGVAAETALALTQRAAAASGLPVWAWAGFGLWTRRLVTS